MKRLICFFLGHIIASFRHPQQIGVECQRCKYIVDRDGRVVHPPLRVNGERER